jgi:hypothetical protein
MLILKELSNKKLKIFNKIDFQFLVKKIIKFKESLNKINKIIKNLKIKKIKIENYHINLILPELPLLNLILSLNKVNRKPKI